MLHHHLSPHRSRWLRPLLRLLACLLLLPHTLTTFVHSYNISALPPTIRAFPSIPNLTKPPTMLAFLLLTITFPIYFIAFILLVRRRRMYPIAGRGSTLLIILGAWLLLLNLVTGTIGLVYEDGLPCTIVIVVDYLHSVAPSILCVLRGWILVFRIEIMNYLDERRWRQEKLTRQMTQMPSPKNVSATIAPLIPQQKSPKNLNGSLRINVQPALEASDVAAKTTITPKAAVASPPSSTVTTTTTSGTSSQIYRRTSALLSPTEESSIPGYWFITHRQYITWSFLHKIIWSVFAIPTIVVAFLLIYDPDLGLSDTLLRANGTISPTESIQDENLFGPLTFFNTPECPPVTKKRWSLASFLVVFIFPPAIWCSWRIWLDKKRRAERTQEKLAVGGEQLISGISHPSSSSSSLDFDDYSSVKSELLISLVIAGIGILGSYLLKAYAHQYFMTYFYTVTIGVELVSIISPLKISLELSKRLREHKAGRRTGRRKDMNKDEDDNTFGMVSSPHHQVYYQLDYILSQPASYSALLSFLQKEHSSENILFLSAAQKFTTAARVLEEAAEWNHISDGIMMMGVVAVPVVNEDAMMMMMTADEENHGKEVSVSSSTQPRDVSPRQQRIRLPPIKNSISPTLQQAFITIPSLITTTTTSSHATSINPSPTAPSTSSSLLLEALRLKSLVHQIHHDYLKKAAVYEVNLPQRISHLIQARHAMLEKWNPTKEELKPPPFLLSSLYCEVYTEVYKLIESDSFRRFILTPAFESLLARADEQQANQLEHQNNLLDETAKMVQRAVETLTTGYPGHTNSIPVGIGGGVKSLHTLHPTTSLMSEHRTAVSLELPLMTSQLRSSVSGPESRLLANSMQVSEFSQQKEREESKSFVGVGAG